MSLQQQGFDFLPMTCLFSLLSYAPHCGTLAQRGADIPPGCATSLSQKSNWRESLLHGSQFASGSRAVPHATAYDAVHGAFMTLPPYSRSREGEVRELGFGVRNGSHRARSRHVSATSERLERECPATSAQGTARCASRWKSDQGGLLCRVVRHLSSQLTKLSGDSGREKCRGPDIVRLPPSSAQHLVSIRGIFC